MLKTSDQIIQINDIFKFIFLKGGEGIRITILNW